MAKRLKKPKPHIRTPKHLVKARQHQVLDMYARGKTATQIAAQLGVHQQVVTRDLNIIIDEMTRQYATSTPHANFVRYAAFQYSIIAKLQSAHDMFMQEASQASRAAAKGKASAKSVPKQYNAAISALRAQSEILDRIYDKGKEFGIIIHKKASDSTRKQPQDLRADLRSEIDKLTTLLDAIDDATQSASIRVTQTSITFTPRIRKPLRNEFGIVSALPDWKYRRRITERVGDSYRDVPPERATPEQLQTIAATTKLEELRTQLALEEARQTQRKQPTTQDSQDTDGGFLVPPQRVLPPPTTDQAE